MVSPDSRAYRARRQAETPLSVLCRFPEPALSALLMAMARESRSLRFGSLFKIWVQLLVLLVVSDSEAKGSDLWEFVQVGKGNQSSPTWAVRTGKAEVENDGRQITIY